VNLVDRIGVLLQQVSLKLRELIAVLGSSELVRLSVRVCAFCAMITSAPV